MKDQKWRTIFPVIHLFILSQKFEKALMMAAKIANNIGCFISHKEKKESKTLFLSFPKYLDHFYSDCIFFPPRFLAVGMVRLIMPSSKVWLFPFS